MQNLLAVPKPLIMELATADVQVGAGASEQRMGDPHVGFLLSPPVLTAVRQRSLVLQGGDGSKEVGCRRGGRLMDAARSMLACKLALPAWQHLCVACMGSQWALESALESPFSWMLVPGRWCFM